MILYEVVQTQGFHGIQIVGTTTGDFDGDGLTDVAELEGTTSPIDADGDDDGLNDGAEIAAGTNPRNQTLIMTESMMEKKSLLELILQPIRL